MTNRKDKLSPFIAASAALHVIVVGVVMFFPSLFPARTEASWGTSSDRGIKVGVTSSLPGIPLPSPRVVRETAPANSSKTLNPAEVAPKTSEPPPPRVADVKIPSGNTKPERRPTIAPAPTRPTRPEPASDPDPPITNAIPGTGGGQAALPYGSVAGSGPATFGGDGSFGTRFPDYVASMTRKISDKWQPSPSIARGAPRVYVTFTINRQGQVSNLEVSQSSGIALLDRSAQIAVREAMPLPTLPPGYSGSTVDVRFYFEYTR